MDNRFILRAARERGGLRMAELVRPRHERYCQEYLVDLNQTRAAARAGYSPRSAGRQGGELMKNEAVRARIRELSEERARNTGVTRERVVRELARVAFANAMDAMREFRACSPPDARADDAGGAGRAEDGPMIPMDNAQCTMDADRARGAGDAGVACGGCRASGAEDGPVIPMGYGQCTMDADRAGRGSGAAVLFFREKRIPTAVGLRVEREVRMYDKLKALELLGMHLGLFPARAARREGTYGEGVGVSAVRIVDDAE